MLPSFRKERKYVATRSRRGSFTKTGKQFSHSKHFYNGALSPAHISLNGSGSGQKTAKWLISLGKLAT